MALLKIKSDDGNENIESTDVDSDVVLQSDSADEDAVSAKNIADVAGDAGKDIHESGTLLEGSGRVPIRKVPEGTKIPYEVLKFIPEDAARHYGFVPLGLDDGVLEVGILNEENIEARDAAAFISAKHNLAFKIFLVSTEDFERVLDGYKSISGEVSEALSEYSAEGEGREQAERELEKNLSGKVQVDIVEEAPVSKIVAVIIQHATEGNASDVHIEPLREKVRVRFRVDGEMFTSLVLPLPVHEAVVARIKILSNIKLDEKRKPQDGRFSARIEGRQVDFRVSTMPSYFGEKVVIRILDPEKGSKTLESVGLTAEPLKLIRAAIARPYGMVLITGPTGSGKSTTLYSMLSELDREKKNIISLEDPIEYNLEGVNQSQVRPEIGYDFASGLRSILRQDPDIIMVGEIRDKDTAELAIQAALTGHLVLSTLHTNTAIGAVSRLVDMGVDPYLIAPTLIMSIGQRLVRKLCDGAGEAIPIEGSIKAIFEKQFSDLPETHRPKFEGQNVYRAKGTSTCPSGTRGRIGVFEVLSVDKEVERIILENPTDLAVYNYARGKGMKLMKDDAIEKAIAGLIPYEEIAQV
ncbi:MAG: hypothetical protein COV07_03640 [Candidatus Vogelbacteria bacterium CG10_big_fil_rev_8_21_14_0_10_45_14]|uniref:Bacterial type II secretion system protein E domain-containing protein n=1 Tax=Candidatus Vogelbacteria bacterium CG10_big_fil_rev_8_21_14_0_10_45_14 TaxID=1975042 RepID=A0A2H0RJ35_9BACT|nr:MAG: hypothetical protein COV07_03640 [Candidatus Vogelbacteria bacterium CG10_big_fil_rev_8_21_14_0_10_45_14]